ncbi:MAG: hypothetical protein ABL951_11800, partial [Alphaproteobacteria bacterium]
ELGLNLNLSRRLQPRLTGDVGFSFSDTLKGGGAVTGLVTPVPVNTGRTNTRFGNGGASGDETSYEGDASLNYQLGEMFSSNLAYSYLRREQGAGQNISENVITLGVRANF